MRLRFHINYRSDTEYSVTTTILGSDSALIFCIVCTYIPRYVRDKVHAANPTLVTQPRGPGVFLSCTRRYGGPLQIAICCCCGRRERWSCFLAREKRATNCPGPS